MGRHEVTVNIEPPPKTDFRFGIADYRGASTATRGVDFSYPGPEFYRWQVVPAGTKTTTVPVRIIDDELRESDEKIGFRLACWSTGTHQWCKNPLTY